MNQLRQSLATHRTRLHAFAGESVEYRRSRFSFTVRAIPGANTTSEAENEFEGRSEILINDFLLHPEDMFLGDVRIKPQRGDQLVFDGKVYDVMPGTSGVAARPSDAREAETWVRVHTDFRSYVESD